MAAINGLYVTPPNNIGYMNAGRLYTYRIAAAEASTAPAPAASVFPTADASTKYPTRP